MVRGKAMKINRACVVVSVALTLLWITPMGVAQSADSANAPATVNSQASPEARGLLRYLDSISGQYTITGQHNYPNEGSRWTDRTYDLTGRYPGLYGADFGFSAGDDKDSIQGRAAMIEEVKRQYRNGAVIALTWHAVRPTEDEPVTFRDSVQGHLTDFEWKELLTPGTNLYKRWCAQVDVIAGYLAQLRDAHMAVLFRPYHEMNGNWFWWGGRPGKNGTPALYRQLYDRMVNYHKLDNLLWVWNVNAPSNNAGPFVDYFPGAQYADVLSVDNYGEFKQSYYDDVLALAGAKPIALAEVGGVPALAVLKDQPKWTYFMIWAGLAEFTNPIEKLREVFDGPNMLNRGDPRLAGALEAMRKTSGETTPEPVTAHASTEGKALLGQLYSVSRKSVLSGQQNVASALSAATAHVVQVTAKSPAIYGAELGITKEDGVEVGTARQAIVEEAKRQHNNHAIVSLSWHATRPTDDEPGSREQSVSGQLSDFEWNELLTPDTDLYKRWCVQVDQVAGYLEQLQKMKVAVLWRPYPEANGKKFWWAGRKGDRGSAVLYRQLFDRMVNHDGLHNLVWVWSSAPPGFGPNPTGAYNDYFPGLLYVDALALNLENSDLRFRMDAFLALTGVGKAIGVEFTSKIPDPSFFAQQTGWAWFLLPAETGGPATRAAAVPDAADPAETLRTLYADPRVISQVAETQTQTGPSPK
jgi:mannan endo-1,4-beta-mannosidase